MAVRSDQDQPAAAGGRLGRQRVTGPAYVQHRVLGDTQAGGYGERVTALQRDYPVKRPAVPGAPAEQDAGACLAGQRRTSHMAWAVLQHRRGTALEDDGVQPDLRDRDYRDW